MGLLRKLINSITQIKNNKIIEQEKLEQEKIEQEKLERKSIKQEKIEAKRLEESRIEQERIEKQRIIQEKIQQMRLEEKRLEQEKIEKQRIVQEKIQQMRLEEEKIERERIRLEKIQQEKFERERNERKRLEQEKFEREEKIQQELRKKEYLEKKIQEQEQLEKERKELKSIADELRMLLKEEKEICHNIFGKCNIIEINDRFFSVRFIGESSVRRFLLKDFSTYFITKKSGDIDSFNKYEHLKEEEDFFANIMKQVNKEEEILSLQKDIESFNFNDFSDSFVPIDQYKNIVGKLDIIRKIQKEPYFARVDYMNHKLYVGKNAYKNIIDWRDIRSQYYYNYKIYINSDYLKLVRDFFIFSNRFLGSIDKFKIQDGIFTTTDDYLVKLIKNNRENNIKDIIMSIQINQYNIISNDKDKNIMVLGCAGSGKTMVLLHKLSYMIYNNDIKHDDIFAVSPNELLNLENNELAYELKLNSINRFSKINFYKYCLYCYRKKYGLPQNLEENMIFEPNLEFRKIFNRDFLNNFVLDVKKIISKSDSDEKGKFIKKIKDYKIHKIKEIYKINSNTFENILTELERTPLFHKYQQIKEYAQKIPPLNLANYINNPSVKKNDRELKIASYIYNNFKLNQTIEAVYVDEENMRGLKINTKDIGIQAIFNEISEKTYKREKNFEELKKFISDYLYVYNFNSYINEEYTFFIEEINEYLINKIKKENNIKKAFEFELLLKLITYSIVFGSLDDKTKYIYIDEFQDFNINEIKTIKLVFNNVIFNFFRRLQTKYEYDWSLRKRTG